MMYTARPLALVLTLAAGFLGSGIVALAGEPLPGPIPTATEPLVRTPPVVVDAPPVPGADLPAPLVHPLPPAAPPPGPDLSYGGWPYPHPHGPHGGMHWYYDQLRARPFGTYLRATTVAQVENGIAAQLVLYHYDFVLPDGRPGAVLNAEGRLHLERLCGLITLSGCPVLIEVDERDPAVNFAQRAAVSAVLQQMLPGFPDERVVIGRPAARGLNAQDAILVQQNRLLQVQAGAFSSFSGAISSSTAVGVGSSAAGAGAGRR
jgi:hypothetical protein